jgi:hypothetical protein
MSIDLPNHVRIACVEDSDKEKFVQCLDRECPGNHRDSSDEGRARDPLELERLQGTVVKSAQSTYCHNDPVATQGIYRRWVLEKKHDPMNRIPIKKHELAPHWKWSAESILVTFYTQGPDAGEILFMQTVKTVSKFSIADIEVIQDTLGQPFSGYLFYYAKEFATTFLSENIIRLYQIQFDDVLIDELFDETKMMTKPEHGLYLLDVFLLYKAGLSKFAHKLFAHTVVHETEFDPNKITFLNKLDGFERDAQMLYRMTRRNISPWVIHHDKKELEAMHFSPDVILLLQAENREYFRGPYIGMFAEFEDDETDYDEIDET